MVSISKFAEKEREELQRFLRIDKKLFPYTNAFIEKGINMYVIKI